MGRQILPVADAPQVRRYARSLLRRHSRGLGATLGLHALAAVAGLAMPWLIGELVESVEHGRVAVVEDGRITELGPHRELVSAGGAYAALWRSWHGEQAASPAR